MEEYTECYVAHLDILGFKNMIHSMSCQKILDIFQNIYNPLKDCCIRVNGNLNSEINMSEDVHIKIMSDSICFYIKSDLSNALFKLLLCCGSFQTKLLELSPPILIRGAVAIGNLYVDGDIIFGPALTTAYVMQEEVAKYPRIILCEDVVNHGISEMKDEIFREALYKLLFVDEDAFCVVNQIEFNEGWQFEGVFYNALTRHISQILASECNPSIREKYLYLKKSFDQRYHLEEN